MNVRIGDMRGRGALRARRGRGFAAICLLALLPGPAVVGEDALPQHQFLFSHANVELLPVLGYHGHIQIDVAPSGSSGGGEYALRAGSVAYDDTVNGSQLGLACLVGAELGDDFTTDSGGLLQDVEFSVFIDPSMEHGLSAVDVTIGVYDGSLMPITYFQVTDVDFTDGGLAPPLAPGEYATVSVSGLAALQIVVPPSFVLSQQYSNVVGDGGGAASAVGQVLFNPPVVGVSDDRYYLNEPPNNGWHSFGGSPVANFYWAVSTAPTGKGDLNCDGAVDLFDIDPFVLALTSAGQNPPFAAYDAAYPGCDAYRADVDGTGAVDLFDIDPFVQLLTGS